MLEYQNNTKIIKKLEEQAIKRQNHVDSMTISLKKSFKTNLDKDKELLQLIVLILYTDYSIFYKICPGRMVAVKGNIHKLPVFKLIFSQFLVPSS